MRTPKRIRYHTTQMTTIAIAVTGLRVVLARLPGAWVDFRTEQRMADGCWQA
jgi:hypothetical protein